MPLKLNVGLSRKLGQPDFGSLGASCHVEVELDSSLIHHDLDTFHRHVKNAYVACAQAVNDELSRHQATTAQATRSEETATPANANGRSNGTGNGASNGHRASDKQLDYAHQLAGQIKGLCVRKLDQLAHRLSGKPLADLTGLEASGLIDTLKAIKAGNVSLSAALEGSREAA